MRRFRIAVIVGGLPKGPFYRKMADAVVIIGPPEFSFDKLDFNGSHVEGRMR